MIDLPGGTVTVSPERWHTTSNTACSPTAGSGCGLAVNRSRCRAPDGDLVPHLQRLVHLDRTTPAARIEQDRDSPRVLVTWRAAQRVLADGFVEQQIYVRTRRPGRQLGAPRVGQRERDDALGAGLAS